MAGNKIISILLSFIIIFSFNCTNTEFPQDELDLLTNSLIADQDTGSDSSDNEQTQDEDNSQDQEEQTQDDQTDSGTTTTEVVVTEYVEVPVVALAGCTQISGGFQEFYGLCNDEVYSLGINNFYQQDMPTFANPTIVASGANVGYVVDSTGTVGFGRDDHGQVSDIPTTTQTTSIDGGHWQLACSMNNNSGFLDCWGADAVTVAWDNVIQYDVGWSTVCAILDDGIGTSLACSGTSIAMPVVTNPTKVAVGHFHICAIGDEGVVCSGSNFYGQTDVPANITNAIDISAGEYHTVVNAENGLFAWGRGDQGQLVLPNISNVVQVDAQHRSTWYLDGNGIVYCRGDNSWGHCPEILDLTDPL